MMNSFAKILARKVVFPVIAETGLHRIIWGDEDKVQILMYHGVNATGDTTVNGRHISAERFEQHLQYLKKHFEVLTLEQAFAAIGTKKTTKPRACITFDDGFENNLIYAVPLLKKYGLPATFFISSVCVTEETDILWSDILDMITADLDSVTVGSLTFARTSHGFYNAEKNLHLPDHIKNQGKIERDRMMDELSVTYDLESKKKLFPVDNWKLINAKQLKELSEFPLVEIASHCHDHYNLASLSEEDAMEELTKSKKLLEDCIGKPVASIAFPDGSYSARVKQQAKDAGYNRLCAVTFKLADDAADKKIVRRSSVSATTNYYSNIIHFHKHFKQDGN